MENSIDKDLVLAVAKRRVHSLQEENIYLTALAEQLSEEINKLNSELSKESVNTN